MRKIDVHAHFYGDHSEFTAMLGDLDLRIINICVAHSPRDEWRDRQRKALRGLAREYPLCYVWCTTIDVPRFDDPNYVGEAIRELDRDFDDGAVGCKVWKNIGMVVKDPSGNFLMVDDALFEPIFSHIGKARKPLIMHIAEPLACWKPLNEDNPFRDYYRKHPEYHMYGKKEQPSHRELMRARDKVIERHPNLTVVGAHLASLEYDVREIAKRFDRYPNFVVDTSGASRIAELARQDRELVRQFVLDYQDRLMYGSDIGVRPQDMSDLERNGALQELKEKTESILAFFEKDEKFIFREREVQGLGLPKKIVQKIFFSNALRWFPDLKW